MANNNHFELTLDTLAPEGSISRGETQAYNTDFDLTIDKGDATFMYVWFDTVQTPGEIPSSGVDFIKAAASYETKFISKSAEDGTYYYHLVLEDDLGNKSGIKSTDPIQFDRTPPTIIANSVKFCKRKDPYDTITVTTTRDVAVKASFEDNLSGCVSYVLEGEIVGDISERSEAYEVGKAYEVGDLIHYENKGYSVYEDNITEAENTSFDAIKSKLILWAVVSGNLTPEEVIAGNMVRDVVLSGAGEEESTKQINVVIIDAAGNISDIATDTVTLDTQFLVGVCVLRNAADTETITDTWVNTADFNIALTASDKSDWAGYKVWGDFNTDGSTTTTPEPTDFTPLTEAEKTAKRVLLPRKFTSGDAENKTVHSAIIDINGNITVLNDVSADVDYTAPTVSIVRTSPDAGYVSLQEDFDEAVFTPTVDASISGAYSYQWYCNDTEWPQAKGGVGLGAPGALTVDANDLPELTEEEIAAGKGARVFKVTVWDNAGNSTTSNGATIYLDTVAPAGSVSMEDWYNRDDADQSKYKKFSTAGVKAASATDAGAGMAYMTCWCSQSATDTTVVGSQIAYKENPGHSDINWDGKAESTTNYVHIEYVDAVGNKFIAHSNAFGIDLTVPATGTVTFTREAYSSVNASVILSSSDTLSGMGTGAKMKLWGSAYDGRPTEPADDAVPSPWEAYGTSKALTMTSGDGEKVIYARFMDVAGNISGKITGQPQADPATDTTELDTSTPTVELALKVQGSEEDKPNYSSVKESDLRIKPTDDAMGKLFYFAYGDFTTGDTQQSQGIAYKDCTLYAENTAYNADVLVLYEGDIYITVNAITAEANTDFDTFVTVTGAKVTTDYWKVFTPDTAKDYKTLATICTSGDGTKVFNCKVMDNVGHKVTADPKSFIYDTEAPTVDITAVQGFYFDRISKVNTKRLQLSGSTITELEAYNDETKFNLVPNSVCQAFKVVAYADKVKAAAGSHADDPIKQTDDAKAKESDPTPKSTNMHGEGIEFGPGKIPESIQSTIKGADYEVRLAKDAVPFSTSTAYVVGDIVSYNGNVYTCTKPHAAGEWVAANFTAGVDGAHIVVAYVQDLAGTWSVAAEFEL